MNLRYLVLAATLVLAAAAATAQSPPAPAVAPVPAVAPIPAIAPATASTPAPPAPSPGSRTVSGIRNKISAGDLPSAESILEVHRDRDGEDGYYLVGLGWLSRGALLLGEAARARELNAELRRLCDARLAKGPGLAKDDSLETALGAAIEVEAQLLAREKGPEAGAAWLRGEIAKYPGPVAFRSRLYKRLNMLALTGSPAPELAVEDFVGSKPAALSALRGSPVVLFVWSATCGDCKAQAASLGRVARRYAERGVVVVPLTRYYEEGAAERAKEKAVVDSVWAAVYAPVGKPSIVVSTASMERYGGSSTPTFVFIDKRGEVKGYTPTRLTEARLSGAVEELLR
jgi:thiol-disulfide isomerase/thioredoxin